VFTCLISLAVYVVIVLLSGHATFEDADSKHVVKDDSDVKPVRRRRVALLIYGVRLETLFETGKSIMKYVVEEANADVFVYGREVAEYNTTGAIKAAFGVDRVKGVYTGKQLDEGDVLALLHQSKRWPELKEVCGDTNMVKSGTLLGLIWSELAYELAASYERSQGFVYDYMVFMRPDVQWFAPFPKLELLDMKYQMWIPTRTPWGGIPASLIVCPRGLCENWARWWSRLRDGSLIEKMTKENAFSKRNCLMSEMFEYAAWKALKVPFGWFSVVHAIVCTRVTKKKIFFPSLKTYFRRVCAKMVISAILASQFAALDKSINMMNKVYSRLLCF
jgi:hypothetical protein